MFSWLFFIFFVEITNKNLVVLCKIRHVYSTIHQLWSNSHQLVKIFIIINRLFFHGAVFIHPIFKSVGQILSTHIFLASGYFCSNWYPATQQRLILKVYVSDFPYQFWKNFYKIRYCFKCKLVFLTWNVFNKSSSLFIVT